MRRSLVPITVFVLALFPLTAPAADFTLDPAHTAVTFRVSHLGLSWTHGRFNDVSGTFTLDKDKSAFTLTIKAAGIDTGNAKRDQHLQSPDFLNVKQFPQISFKSKTVKPVAGGYQVSGDFTLHGQTKPITFTLQGGREAEFPKGTQRTGFTTGLVIKRSDYGINGFPGAVGDEIHIAISFEGTKK
jgi:polyisoprenoid-binding protein YceI